MRFELTGDTLCELLAEGSAGALPIAHARSWPERVGAGTFDSVEVRPGVVLYLLDLAPATDILFRATPGDGYLECSYHLRGYAEGTIDGARTRIQAAEGCRMAAVAPPGAGGAAYFSARQPIVTVAICVSPAGMSELFPTPWSTRVERWHRAVATRRPLVEAPGQLSIRQRIAAQQLPSCPFTGTARRLFLESRVLELLAWELGSDPQSVHGTPRDDEARIHAAADILIAHLDDPPTLRELARAVGTNELKLKRGFRVVFGTTVFGYLRAHRLQLARELLAGSDVSVTEAALLVGYACPSRFAAAFRRHFGEAPSALRRTH